MSQNNDIHVFNWIENNGIKYQINDLILKNYKDNLPIFGLVKSIILNNEKIEFVLEELKTLKYLNHKTGYLLKNQEATYSLIALDQIQYPFPINLYNYDVNEGLKIVIPTNKI